MVLLPNHGLIKMPASMASLLKLLTPVIWWTIVWILVPLMQPWTTHLLFNTLLVKVKTMPSILSLNLSVASPSLLKKVANTNTSSRNSTKLLKLWKKMVPTTKSWKNGWVTHQNLLQNLQQILNWLVMLMQKQLLPRKLTPSQWTHHLHHLNIKMVLVSMLVLTLTSSMLLLKTKVSMSN